MTSTELSLALRPQKRLESTSSTLAHSFAQKSGRTIVTYR